jgi:hypothetical protein
MTTNKSANQPTIVLKLVALPHVTDPIRALRAALKQMLRQHGLKCIGIAEQTDKNGGRQ